MTNTFRINTAFTNGDLVLEKQTPEDLHVLRSLGHSEKYAYAAEAPIVPFVRGFDDYGMRLQTLTDIPHPIVEILTHQQEQISEETVRDLSRLLTDLYEYRSLLLILDGDYSRQVMESCRAEIKELVDVTREDVSRLQLGESIVELNTACANVYRQLTEQGLRTRPDFLMETLGRLNKHSQNKYKKEIEACDHFDSRDTCIQFMLSYMDQEGFFLKMV